MRRFAKQHRYSVTEYGCSAAITDISIIISASDLSEWVLDRGNCLSQCFGDSSGFTVEYIVAGRHVPRQLVQQLNRTGCYVKHISFSRAAPSSIVRNKAADYASGRWVLFASVGSLPPKVHLEALLRTALGSNVGVVGLPVETADRQQWYGLGVAYQDGGGPLIPLPGPLEVLSAPRELVAIIPGFLLCSRQLFFRAKKFDERLSGGLEEIALCWTMARKLHCRVAVVGGQDSARAVPELQKIVNGSAKGSARFYTAYQSVFLRQRIESCLSAGVRDERSDFTIGLVITDDAENTMAGDVFTAKDLALSFKQELGWNIRFLPRLSKKSDWYDAVGLDCILVLLDDYDIRKLKNKRPSLIVVAWLRNWFERWVHRRWFHQYHLALCSSELAMQYVTQHSPLRAEVLRIASNTDRFNPQVKAQKALASDCCFTGSYWRAPREIEKFNPKNSSYTFAVYGSGWQKHKNFSDCWRGELPYEQLPAVYASSTLLIDDANHVTKPWGSVNSRVFDALASGILVLTNGVIGARETFGEALPCYDGVEELEAKIAYYLNNPHQRQQLADALHLEVLQHHSYRHRAHEFKNMLKSRFLREVRVAIKIAVPHRRELEQWGDFHFAVSLAKALEKQGYPVRIDILPEWYCEPALQDDVVIVIRGLSAYVPSPNQLNLLWQISHPDKIDDDEYELYDHVFVASEPYARLLQQRLQTAVTPLLQCTDPRIFYYDERPARQHQLLFVGNSRKQFRPSVRHAIELKLPVTVYGTHWQDFIGQEYIGGAHIENSELRLYYAGCGVLLNDHWGSMQRQGFVSNRLFDAAACGAIVVSDRVAGIDELFHGLVYQYDLEGNDFAARVNQALQEGESKLAQRQHLAEEMAQRHSFDARAAVLVEAIADVFGTVGGRSESA